MHFMVKEMDIFFKSLRMALLCFAVLIYGAPVAASMSNHDMTIITSQAMSASMVDSDCTAHEIEQSQADDCCQTDDCERTCASHANLMMVDTYATMPRVEVNAYAGYIDHSLNPYDDTNNPPPIA